MLQYLFYQEKFYEQYRLHFIHASDEWYINAEREFPEEERYDNYIQLENGVGMMRLLINEFREAFEQLIHSKEYESLRNNLNRTITIAVGKLAYPTIKTFAKQLQEVFPNLTIHTYYIRNDFFGETVTVSGLITGKDLVKQLKEQQEKGIYLGDTLQITSSMLRMGENVFLDDMTIAEAEQQLGMKVVPVESSGRDFIEAIINPFYHNGRDNRNFVYLKAYDR